MLMVPTDQLSIFDKASLMFYLIFADDFSRSVENTQWLPFHIPAICLLKLSYTNAADSSLLTRLKTP
jgi:hypothetical protein